MTRSSAAPPPADGGRRLRVLMVTDAVGGIWNFSLELAAGLRPHHIEVILAVLGPEPSPQQRAAAHALEITLVATPLRLEWMDDPWDDVRKAGSWLATLERDHDCQLVHVNGYSLAAAPFQAPVVVVGHSCVLSWWRAVRTSAPLPPHMQRYRRAVAKGLRAAAAIVAPTAWMGDALKIHYRCEGDVAVIPNGIDQVRFAPGEKEPFIFSAGRIWDEAKNLRALAHVADQLPWPVCIAGAAALGGGSGDQAPAPDALSGVEVLGNISTPEMARLYARASIYALPARYEPFGLSILEAAMSGCALVLGDIPSLRELWDGAARFVDPGDEHGLGRALQALIDDPTERRRVAGHALERSRRYRSDTMASAYAGLYRRLTRPQSPREQNLHRPDAAEESTCAS